MPLICLKTDPPKETQRKLVINLFPRSFISQVILTLIIGEEVRGQQHTMIYLSLKNSFNFSKNNLLSIKRPNPPSLTSIMTIYKLFKSHCYLGYSVFSPVMSSC